MRNLVALGTLVMREIEGEKVGLGRTRERRTASSAYGAVSGPRRMWLKFVASCCNGSGPVTFLGLDFPPFLCTEAKQ